MPVPTVTIAGIIANPDGSPLAGKRLTFELQAPITDADDNTIIAARKWTALTDSDGAIKASDGTSDFTLVPSDATGLAPNPVGYVVTEQWRGGRAAFTVLIPSADPTVNYTDLAPIGNPPDPPSAYVELEAYDITVAALQTADTDEATAREAADTANTDAIAAETARAEGIEAGLIPLTQKGATDGVATLDGSGTVPDAQIPATITRDTELTAAVSAAVAAVINGAPGAMDTLKELADALGDDPNYATTITNALALKAPLASPALTGNPTAPTQSAGDNTTKLATTAFTTGAVAAEVTRANGAYESFVIHGSTASTARPSGAGQVLWTGSVAPTNAATNDLWIDTTTHVVKRYTGTAWDANGASVVAKSYATVTASNTAVETTVLSLTLPANKAQVGDYLRLKAMATIVQNRGGGGAVTYTFRLYVGGALVLTSNNISVTADANLGACPIEADIFVESMTAQRIDFRSEYRRGSTDIDSGGVFGAVGYGTSSAVLTSDNTVVLTVQMNVADAGSNFACQGGALMRLPF